MSYFSQKSSKTKENVQSAMTIMDYEGHIVGIVGGAGEKTVNRGLNRAIDSPRQPGSTMKPIGVYAPAIDSGVISYSSVYVDSPLDSYYPDGKKGPLEWYGYYAGSMSIEKAIERSANTIPCKILDEMGVNVSFEFLTQKVGYKHLNDDDKNLASLALGGCVYGVTTTESAAAYAIFGNQGKYYTPLTYYFVKDSNDVTVLKDGKSVQAIKPGAATLMNKLLQNVVYGSSGTGRGIVSYNKMKAYAKTGTSSESNDLWMVAGTPYYVGSLWYGFDKPQRIWNQSAAATLWKNIMKEVHSNLEIKEFDLSEDLITAQYCTYTGKLAGSKCYSKKDGLFIPELETPICDGVHKVVSSSSSSESSSGTESITSQTTSSGSDSSSPSNPEDSTSAQPDTSSETNNHDNNESNDSGGNSGNQSGEGTGDN